MRAWPLGLSLPCSKGPAKAVQGLNPLCLNPLCRNPLACLQPAKGPILQKCLPRRTQKQGQPKL
jgi:hypothetical protein